FMAVVTRLKTFITGKYEWLTVGVFIVMLITISFSGFKLPHYLNIVLPTTAVLTAAFLIEKKGSQKWVRVFNVLQLIVTFLLLALSLLIHAWAFPVSNGLIIAGLVFLLALVFYYFKSKMYDQWTKSILIPASAMILVFFLLNLNFYPRLLTYQGGNQLAKVVKDPIDPNEIYLWKDYYSSSFNFYTKTIRKEFSDTSFREGRRTWILADRRNIDEIRAEGYLLGKSFSANDYEITKLDIKFINPARRPEEVSQMVLVEVLAKLK